MNVQQFKEQEFDPVNGNNFVKESFGANAEKRWKMWKLFFGFQDPRKLLQVRKPILIGRLTHFWLGCKLCSNVHGTLKSLALVMSNVLVSLESMMINRESTIRMKGMDSWLILSPNLDSPITSSSRIKQHQAITSDRVTHLCMPEYCTFLICCHPKIM
jgi:hypothetical protein